MIEIPGAGGGSNFKIENLPIRPTRDQIAAIRRIRENTKLVMYGQKGTGKSTSVILYLIYEMNKHSCRTKEGNDVFPVVYEREEICGKVDVLIVTKNVSKYVQFIEELNVGMAAKLVEQSFMEMYNVRYCDRATNTFISSERGADLLSTFGIIIFEDTFPRVDLNCRVVIVYDGDKRITRRVGPSFFFFEFTKYSPTRRYSSLSKDNSMNMGRHGLGKEMGRKDARYPDAIMYKGKQDRFLGYKKKHEHMWDKRRKHSIARLSISEDGEPDIRIRVFPTRIREDITSSAVVTYVLSSNLKRPVIIYGNDKEKVESIVGDYASKCHIHDSYTPINERVDCIINFDEVPDEDIKKRMELLSPKGCVILFEDEEGSEECDDYDIWMG